jgi:glycerol-3-phosphate dehydrogenase
MTDDARLTLETVVDATQHGAAVLTYGRAVELIRNEAGRITAVRVKDVLDRSEQPRTVDVSAAVVINATGPWSDSVRSMGPQVSHQLRTTKGVHIVVPAHKVPLEHTIVGTHPRDNRVLFIIPWGDQVYVGTTDTDYEGDPREVSADRADIDYLIEAIDAYFPSSNVRPDDITATWAGLRPLIRADGVHPSQVSREHVITVDPDGLISIAGGKLTTYRLMAEQAVDQIVEAARFKAGPCRTATEPLLSPDQVTPFSGIHPPEVTREAVEHYVRHEWAFQLEDVMDRRSGWHYYDRLSYQKVSDISRWMGNCLGWSIIRTQSEINAQMRRQVMKPA